MMGDIMNDRRQNEVRFVLQNSKKEKVELLLQYIGMFWTFIRQNKIESKEYK